MYTTLIVDDEQLMRQYLSNHLSTICPDFCVTGIACDGLAAVELIQKQSFDLVITDIKMPEMDGLNLVKYISNCDLNTKVIIVSGYNEFEYARTALKYGVSDYLLKPLSDLNIIDTLSKIKDELDLETSQRYTTISASIYDNYSDSEIKSSLLSSIISENTNSIQLLYNSIQHRNISFISSYSAIMLLCIDDLNLLLYEKTVSENTFYRFELNQQCQTICKVNNYVTAYVEPGYTIVLLSAKSEEEIATLANDIYSELVHNYWKYDKIKINSTIGSIVKDMMDLSASYSIAVESFALTLKNSISPISSKYFISQRRFIKELNTICEAIYFDYISKNYSKTYSDLSLYIMLFQDNICIANALKYGTYIIRYLTAKCNIKNDFTISAFKELTTHIDQYISTEKLDKDHTLAILFSVLKTLYHEQIINTVPETAQLVENAKEFICTHYQEQISLVQVADYLNVNPSYLSDLFHKSIGEPYTKYIARIRMEQAILLLKSNPNEKIYIVAERTGFVSSKHFNAVFKKFYGITPTEFLNRN